MDFDLVQSLGRRPWTWLLTAAACGGVVAVAMAPKVDGKETARRLVLIAAEMALAIANWRASRPSMVPVVAASASRRDHLPPPPSRW